VGVVVGEAQAVLWKRNSQELEVALHVRTFVEAEMPEASASLRTLVRQQLDSLLLSIPAMNAARVRFGDVVEDFPARLLRCVVVLRVSV
jgi:hypothetical protein